MVATAPSSTAVWAGVPFGEFLHLLRRNGFAVGLQHYARMMTLLDGLGADCPPARLRSMLAPVFATTPDQQDRFYRLFDQWFPMFVPDWSDGVRRPADAVAGDVAVPGARERRGPVKRRRRYLPALTAIAAASLLVMIWWVTRRETSVPTPVDTTAPTAPLPPTQAPLPLPAPTQPAQQPIETSAPEFHVNWQLVRVGLALLLVIGFVANEWRHYRRRRIVLERQRRERPPLVWPIRVEAASTPMVESSEFLTAARRLRERQTGDRERLDIAATIAATIRAQGRPVLRYVKETRPPEYLILIERASARDHQARLFHHLIEHLAAEGVHATVYWCEEDPRICEPVVEGPTATLVELRHKFPSHRLLVFGSGDGLIDPISGRRKAWVADAMSWPDRALLTPESPESWSAREVALAGHLIVLPATLGGLQAAIDHFQIPSRAELSGRRRRPSHVPEPDAKEAVRAIKAWIGPRGLQWVCACAVYPDLQWNLTLHLGMLPELGGVIDDNVLTKLVRLPWFRQGAIPDEARAVLLRVIEPEVERAARRTIIALLERNPAPPETIASSRFELDLVVQKFALQARSRARRRDLANVARRAPRERVMSELAVLHLTEGDPTSTVAMRLPERLREVFFHGGVSVLGLTSGARSVVMVALVAGVLFVGPGDALPPDLVADQRADSTPPAVDSLAPRADVPTATTPPPVPDTAAARVAQRPADSTSAPAPAPSTSVTPPLTPLERLVRAESAVRSRQYGVADSIAQEMLRELPRGGGEPIRMLTVSAAAAFPPTGAQDRARALEAIRFLLDANPAFRFPADMTWPGLDQLLEEQRTARTAAARAATVGVIQIGSRSPNATLYINGAIASPISSIRSIQLPGGESHRLSIRVAGCGVEWDTTIVVPRGDTLALGFREATCTAPTPTPPPAAPDPAVIDRLIDHARSESLSRLQGPWTTLNKAPRVTFGSRADQQRLAGGVREGTLVGTVRTVGTRTAGGTAVTEDSVFLTADVRFAWRTFVGANQANDATIELVFERTSGTPQLRRMHIVLRTAR